MERPKGSPPRTGDGTPASVPPFNQVQHGQDNDFHNRDQRASLHKISCLKFGPWYREERDAECIQMAAALARRSPVEARHWHDEYLVAATRLETANGNHPVFLALAENLRARAAAMQAVWA